MVWVVSLSTTELISRSLTPAKQDNGIRSVVVGPGPAPGLGLKHANHADSVARLYLNIFRGEPAISEFD